MSRNDPFGLLAFLQWNHAWNYNHFDPPTLKKSMDQLQDLGISFIRMDILWSDINAGAGKFDFSHYDEIMAQLEKKKIHVLAILNYNKNYAVDGKEVWNHPPESLDEFAGYVSATVSHYKHWIKYWEIWNEPNHPTYWGGPQDGLKLYSQLLKKSYAAAKKADPSCIVLNGGITMGIVDDVDNLYREAGKESFDVLNIHPFINPKKPNATKVIDDLIVAVEKVTTKYGDTQKKIWLTEIGCPGVPKGKKANTWFEGEALSEEEQAEWLKTIYGLIKKHPRVEKLFWAFYRDTDGIFNDAVDHLGIVRLDLSPKPAFFALKRLISDHAVR